MNKRIIITMCITSFILTNLAACVKTPEEKIVTDKKKGSISRKYNSGFKGSKEAGDSKTLDRYNRKK